MVDEPEKTLSVKERLALQKNPTAEKKEEVISCSALRPICLNRPRGKLKQIDGKNKLENPQMTLDCLGDDYTPVMGLDYLIESFNEKKIFARKSNQKDAFCYQMDLAWYMIFNDIILNIDGITVNIIKLEIEIEKRKGKKEEAEEPEAEEPEAEEPEEADIEQLEIESILTIEEAEKAKIDFYILFTKLIAYGEKKWEMEKVMTDYKECDSADCPYLTANKNNKNDCIAFILLNKFRELINDKGFKVFSDCLKSPMTMPEIQNNTKASDILNAIKEVFKLSFFLMNDKTDLTNVYNNQEIETIYTEINEKTKQIKGVFDVYAQIDSVTKSGGGKTADIFNCLLGVTLLSIGTSPFTVLTAPFALAGAVVGGSMLAVVALCVGLTVGTGRLISGVKHLFDSKEMKEKRRKLEESKKIAKEQQKEDIEKYMNYTGISKRKSSGELKEIFIGTYKKTFGIYTLEYYRARGKDEVIFYKYRVQLVGMLVDYSILDTFMVKNKLNIKYITDIINRTQLRPGHETNDKIVRTKFVESTIKSLDELKIIMNKNVDAYKVKNKKNVYQFMCLFLLTRALPPWEEKAFSYAHFSEIKKGITGGRKSHRVKHKTRRRKNRKTRKTKKNTYNR